MTRVLSPLFLKLGGLSRDAWILEISELDKISYLGTAILETANKIIT
jgi:hypothetical protein